MAITINDKTYRNLPEQVKENASNIEDLQERVSDLENAQITVDDALSGTSTNPVQNKVVYNNISALSTTMSRKADIISDNTFRGDNTFAGTTTYTGTVDFTDATIQGISFDNMMTTNTAQRITAPKSFFNNVANNTLPLRIQGFDNKTWGLEMDKDFGRLHFKFADVSGTNISNVIDYFILDNTAIYPYDNGGKNLGKIDNHFATAYVNALVGSDGVSHDVSTLGGGGLTLITSLASYHAPSTSGALSWETFAITGTGIDASKPVIIRHTVGDFAFAGYIDGTTLYVYVRGGGYTSTQFEVYQ